jgi:hypothetical protein
VSCEGNQKNKRERLCHCIVRPPVAVPRLSLSSTGKVVYSLKARGSRRPTGMERLRWRSTGRPSAGGLHRSVGGPGPAQSDLIPEST